MLPLKITLPGYPGDDRSQQPAAILPETSGGAGGSGREMVQVNEVKCRNSESQK